MINLCVLPSTASCRKAHRWLLEHRIPFHERNMNAQPLTETEIKHLLQYTYNGIDDLISTKSNAYHQLSKTTPIEDMPLSEAVRVLSQTPQLLRRPIIFDDHRLLCGFNQDEIRMFIPREQRVLKMQAMSEHQTA